MLNDIYLYIRVYVSGREGQGFGSHPLLAGSSFWAPFRPAKWLPGLIRISVTQLYNTTELCEASGWVGYTEMWCRLVPKGASPLAPGRRPAP